VNLLTPLGSRAVRAEVRTEASLKDGKPCIVLDYSKTSSIARWIRDEIRPVGAGGFVGLVFVRGRQAPLRFWLDFAVPDRAS